MTNNDPTCNSKDDVTQFIVDKVAARQDALASRLLIASLGRVQRAHVSALTHELEHFAVAFASSEDLIAALEGAADRGTAATTSLKDRIQQLETMRADLLKGYDDRVAELDVAQAKIAALEKKLAKKKMQPQAQA